MTHLQKIIKNLKPLKIKRFVQLQVQFIKNFILIPKFPFSILRIPKHLLILIYQIIEILKVLTFPIILHFLFVLHQVFFSYHQSIVAVQTYSSQISFKYLLFLSLFLQAFWRVLQFSFYLLDKDLSIAPLRLLVSHE